MCTKYFIKLHVLYEPIAWYCYFAQSFSFKWLERKIGARAQRVGWRWTIYYRNAFRPTQTSLRVQRLNNLKCIPISFQDLYHCVPWGFLMNHLIKLHLFKVFAVSYSKYKQNKPIKEIHYFILILLLTATPYHTPLSVWLITLLLLDYWEEDRAVRRCGGDTHADNNRHPLAHAPACYS